MPEMSKQGLIIYQAISDRFEYLTKHQWSTTNYVVLIYAAIGWIGQHVQYSFRLVLFLSVIAAATGVLGAILVGVFQYDLGKLRLRAQAANNKYLSPEELSALKPHPWGSNPFWHGWHVPAALIAVCLGGAVLVILFLFYAKHDLP
jgi:hypothetical protein